jgi:hypothetical protein
MQVVHGASGTHEILVAKPEEAIPLRKPRFKWENNIKMDHE